MADFKRLKAKGRFHLSTDRDGRDLSGAGLGNRHHLYAVQHVVWADYIDRSKLELVTGHGSMKPQDASSFLLAYNPHGHMFTVDAGLQITGIRRDKAKGKTDFVPDDIIDVSSVALPMLDATPASFVYFLQRGPMRAIIANFRPEKETLESWPNEEKAWFLEAFAENQMLWTYGHLPRIIDTLNQHAIPFSPGVEPQAMALTLDAARAGGNIEEAMINAFRNYDWEESLHEWQTHAGWRRRSPIFRDMLAGFQQRVPGGVIAQGFSQLEGLIVEFLGRFREGLDHRGAALRWPQLVDQLEFRVAREALGPIRRRSAVAAIAFLREAGLYDNFSWNSNQSKFSRHQIQHGKNVDYPTMANAIRIWLVLDSLFWISGFQHREPQPGDGHVITVP